MTWGANKEECQVYGSTPVTPSKEKQAHSADMSNQDQMVQGPVLTNTSRYGVMGLTDRHCLNK